MTSQEVQRADCGPVNDAEMVVQAVYAKGVFQQHNHGDLCMQPGVQSVYINPEMEHLVEVPSGLSQKAQQETLPESLHCELLQSVSHTSLHHSWSQQPLPAPMEPLHLQSGFSHGCHMATQLSPRVRKGVKEIGTVTARAFELLQPAQMLLHLQQQQASDLETVQSTSSQNTGERTWVNLRGEAVTHAMLHLDGRSVTHAMLHLDGRSVTHAMLHLDGRSLEGQLVVTSGESAAHQIHQPASLVDAAGCVEISTPQNLPVEIISEGLAKGDLQAGQTEASREKHLQDVHDLGKDKEVFSVVCYADEKIAELQSELSGAVLSTDTGGTSQTQPAASSFAEMYLHASQLLCELSETIAASKRSSPLDSDKVDVAESDTTGVQGDRPHQCSVCKAAFKQQSHLRAHMLSHSSCRPHKCSECQAAFKRPSDLNCHRRAVHGRAKQFCHRLCPPGRKKGVLATKGLPHSSRNVHQCSQCKASFKTQNLLKKHSLGHIGENHYQCRECKSSFKRMADLKCHRQIHCGKVKSCSLAARKAVRENQIRQTVSPCAGISLKASQLLSELSETAASGRRSRLGQKTLLPAGSSERPHQCKVCAASFKLASHLKGHMVVHSSDRPYQCNVCEFAFKKKYLLKNHMVVHCSDRPYRCSDCNGTFKRFKDVRSHKLIHCRQKKSDLQVVASLQGDCQKQLGITSSVENSLTFSVESATGVEACDRAYKCSECKSAFDQVSLLKSHILSHSGEIERPYQSAECKFAFETAGDLNFHRAVSHSDDRPHECVACRATFKTKSLLKNHMMWVHNNERPHQCSDCKAAFKTKSRLKNHSLIHTSDRPYKCGLCQASFKKAIYLRGHMQSHSDERPFQCPECDSSFKRFQDLKFHRMIHSGEKPYACSECGLAFRKLGYLKSHTLIHSDDKPFKCSECQAVFKRSAALKFHRLVHGDDKPYRCSECNAAFNRLAQLNEHMVFHTGHAPVRPYLCNECKAAFKSSFDLKKHMNTHSTERPHQCIVCKAFFKSMFTLRNHMITHSDQRPHQCIQCNAAFKTSYRLKKHMLVHTNSREEKTARIF